MKNKKSLIIYHDYLDTIFSELSPEEIGQLLVAIIEYDRDGVIKDFEDRTVRTAYKKMLTDCSTNRIKYEEACEKQRQKVMKRWHKEEKN